MTAPVFTALLAVLIEQALVNGVPLPEVRASLAVASMVLDEREPVLCFAQEPPF